MSWVKLDDGAFEHPKLLAAGPRAAWLWICCLSYCNGQKRRDGFVPRARIATLYPGVSAKDAKRLVEVGLLLEDEADGYWVHDYHEYQPEKEFSELQSERGAKGGSVRSEAKRVAALNREASKREAQAETTSADHKPASALEHKPTTSADHKPLPGPSRPVPTNPDPEQQQQRDLKASPREEPFVPCPADLRLTENQRDTLKSAMIPEYAIDAFSVKFVAKHVGNPDDKRTLIAWRKGLASAVAGDWNAGQRPKPPGEVEHEKRKADDDQDLVRRATRGEYGDRIRQMALVRTPPAKLRAAIRERAEGLKAKPPEREQRAPRRESAVDPAPVEAQPEDDDGREYAPLAATAAPPTPAASSPGAGPVNLGGFAASLIREKQAERERERQARGGS